MLTGEIRNKINRVWDSFWAGGIANPLEVIEQITYLLFIKRLDELHTAEELKANRLKRPMERRIFPEGKDDHPRNPRPYEDYRWSRFKNFAPADMYELISEHVFPFLRKLGGDNSTYAHHMRDARITIPTTGLLAKVVDLLDDVPMEDRDTKGDLYEYMLGKIATAGQNGQFRTPRHIIRLMVEMVAPHPDDIICDPACGTAGFLMIAGEYIREKYPEALRDPKLRTHFHHELFHGFDFDSTMLRIGSMNMLLHGVENPDIRYRDSLAHTVALFGEPVFRYGVEQAILDGWLVDYDPVAIHSNVRIKGVILKEGEQIGKIDTQTGVEALDNVEDDREFDASAIESDITAPDSTLKIIQEIAKHVYEHEEATGRFPKILIFAVNDLPHTSHADQLVRICRDMFNQGDEFVQKITGNPNVDRPLQRIREFRNRPNPKIVVTVDMLSTGVDIPALEFIVFLRPVKSRILWEQMLERGTRRCEDINKSKFVVFDCCDGTLFRYFKDVSNFEIEEPRADPLPIADVIENIWQNIDRNYHIKILVKRLHRIAKEMSADARDEFNNWIADGDVAKFTTELPNRLRDNFDETMKLLRNKNFQQLLTDYPRAKRMFWVGYEVEDKVTSRQLFGKWEKPEDYLEAFAKFVRENVNHFEALRILLKRPQDWNPEVLGKLRHDLRANDYDEKRLRTAHEKVYRKQLADVISMIKHAADQHAPLLTAQERVTKAVEELEAFHSFTPEQKKWLGFIGEHLKENLSISEQDLDYQPVFAQRGGLARARKIFGNELQPLIDRLNYTLVAA